MSVKWRLCVVGLGREHVEWPAELHSCAVRAAVGSSQLAMGWFWSFRHPSPSDSPVCIRIFLHRRGARIHHADHLMQQPWVPRFAPSGRCANQFKPGPPQRRHQFSGSCGDLSQRPVGHRLRRWLGHSRRNRGLSAVGLRSCDPGHSKFWRRLRYNLDG